MESSFPFSVNYIGLQSFGTPVFFIKRLCFRLRTKIEHGRGVGSGELEKMAAYSLLPVFRENQQLGNGAKIIAVRKNPQAAYKPSAVVSGYIQGFG